MSEGQLRRSDYQVHSVSISVASPLIRQHHYARGHANTATYLHGLFAREDPMQCLGVAWWMPPTRVAAEANWEGDFREVLTLSRLVIVPDVPKNAASFLIGKSIHLIRKDGRFCCLLTYADTSQGHDGGIYRATNWEYMGLTTPEPMFVSPDGRMTARKAGPRTRTRAEMEDLGYIMIGRFVKHRFRMVIRKQVEPSAVEQMALEFSA